MRECVCLRACARVCFRRGKAEVGSGGCCPNICVEFVLIVPLQSAFVVVVCFASKLALVIGSCLKTLAVNSFHMFSLCSWSGGVWVRMDDRLGNCCKRCHIIDFMTKERNGRYRMNTSLSV